MYEGKHKITYYDLDLLGSVKLSAFLRMVHIAADENASSLGTGFNELSALNMSYVLQRFAVRANRMPAYGECVTIRTWPECVSKGTFIRKGDMYCEKGEKLMEWASMWILLDLAARKILRPSALPVALPDFVDYGVDLLTQKIILPEPGEAYGEEFSRYIHTVRYAEVDTNRHMNNSIYGDLIGNALFPTIEAADAAASRPWREIHINYLAETRLGDEIDVTARRNGGTFLITGTANGRASFAARVSS